MIWHDDCFGRPQYDSRSLKVWTMNETGSSPEHEISSSFLGFARVAYVLRQVRPHRRTAGAIAVAAVLFGAMLVASQTTVFAAPITINTLLDLDFGTLAGDTTLAGTATIDPATNAKTVSGGVMDFGGVHRRASFLITGDPNVAFTVILPSSVTVTSGGNSMTLNGFSSSPSGVGTLNALGIRILYVGATLQVGAGQAAGTYSGAFTVIVNY